MSPQTLIKSAQELAKEEGEESEAKLREAIEILEGVISTIVGSWQDPRVRLLRSTNIRF